MASQRPAILVLCTGNSCRSQMAEAYLRRFAGDRFEVHSAGTEPVEAVHPLAVRVLAEDGLDVSGQHPKDYRDFLGEVPIHTVVIVCDGAAQACPSVWPGALERLLWPTDDPAAFVGDEEETLAEFRRVRDELKRRAARWAGDGAAAGPADGGETAR